MPGKWRLAGCWCSNNHRANCKTQRNAALRGQCRYVEIHAIRLAVTTASPSIRWAGDGAARKVLCINFQCVTIIKRTHDQIDETDQRAFGNATASEPLSTMCAAQVACRLLRRSIEATTHRRDEQDFLRNSIERQRTTQKTRAADLSIRPTNDFVSLRCNRRDRPTRPPYVAEKIRDPSVTGASAETAISDPAPRLGNTRQRLRKSLAEIVFKHREIFLADIPFRVLQNTNCYQSI